MLYRAHLNGSKALKYSNFGKRYVVLTLPAIPHYPPLASIGEYHTNMRKELTVRGLIIGIIITLVFTAANVYFGLKAGLTFSTSIPAAVISMAILRGFKNATIQENNIVQTVASAAGTLSSIIFVLPGLIMIGWWTEFPFWTSFWICALGGILGVMYSIPLRRALVTQFRFALSGRCRMRRSAQGREQRRLETCFRD